MWDSGFTSLALPPLYPRGDLEITDILGNKPLGITLVGEAGSHKLDLLQDLRTFSRAKSFSKRTLQRAWPAMGTRVMDSLSTERCLPPMVKEIIVGAGLALGCLGYKTSFHLGVN